MKVILRSAVENLGRAGDVKDVADGYGRNFLLPKRLAVAATPVWKVLESGSNESARLTGSGGDGRADDAVMNMSSDAPPKRSATALALPPARDDADV